MKSTVSAPNDSTIVLGGLITQDDNRHDQRHSLTSAKSRVIGKLLFSSRTHGTQDRNELIILLHPEVVNTRSRSIKGVLPKEENRTYLGHDLEAQLLPNWRCARPSP